jgi:YesN/AraC family two-component response regulator
MSLESIAEECHVSPRYLSQVFKKSVNITVNAYISIAKIDRAISYITSEQMQFSEVASILGFSSAQYFSTVFKKYTGVTPSEFLESSSIHPL